MTAIEIGRRIQAIRLDNGFEIDEVAEYMEIDPTYIEELEAGETNINRNFLKQIAEVMSCDVNFLLNGY